MFYHRLNILHRYVSGF